MSSHTLSIVLTGAVLVALAIWVPLLESFAWSARRRDESTKSAAHAGVESQSESDFGTEGAARSRSSLA